MKITSIKYVPNKQATGLEPIVMDRLSDVVVITGRNGSGKTRLLNCLNQAIGHCQNLINKLNQSEKEKERLEQRVKLGENHFRDSIVSQQKIIDEIIADQANNKIETDKDIRINLLDIFPKQIAIQTPEHTLSSLKSIYQGFKNIRTDGIASSIVPYIEYIMQEEVMMGNDSYLEKHDLEEVRLLRQSISRLKYMIKDKLGREITIKKDRVVMFGDRSIRAMNLSSGESLILQIIGLLFTQPQIESENHGTIFLMDEPENHLHPAALIESIQQIREKFPDTQIWIATHSISVIAHFHKDNPYSIWYMEDGKIERGGKNQKMVLNGLLGDEEEQAKIRDFLDLPGITALYQFATESLFPPNSVETGAEDPQMKQIREAIDNIKGTDKLKILDYGCGKGRLLQNLLDVNGLVYIQDDLEYYGFDPCDDYKDNLVSLLGKFYADPEKRIYNQFANLKDTVGKQFNIVVMTNVLHEIEPTKWLDAFKNIDSVLSENGYLVIVEDTLLPQGENPNNFGHLVLSISQLRKLFLLDGCSHFISQIDKDGRLQLSMIPKSKILNANSTTMREAFEDLKLDCKEKIAKLREKGGKDYKAGREHAFHITQLANVTLALEHFK